MSYLNQFTLPRFNTGYKFPMAGGTYTVTPVNPTGNRTLTVADPSGNDTFAYLNAVQTLSNKTLTTCILGSNLSANFNNITLLADPVSAQDAVNLRSLGAAAVNPFYYASFGGV